MQDVLPKAVTVDPGDTIASAARRMRDADAGSCVVMENGGIVGSVSERDLVTKLVAENRIPDQVLVRDLMTPAARLSDRQIQGRIVDVLGTPPSALEDAEGVYELALTGSPIDLGLLSGVE